MTKWLKERLPTLLKEVPSDFQMKFSEKSENDEFIGALSPGLVKMARLFAWLNKKLIEGYETRLRTKCDKESSRNFTQEQMETENDMDAVRANIFTSLWHELGIYPQIQTSLKMDRGAIVAVVPKKIPDRDAKVTVNVVQISGPLPSIADIISEMTKPHLNS